MGIKERRTKILLSLFLLSDELNFVSFNEKVQDVFDLSFNQKTRGTLSALMKEGSIEKNGEELQYKLTQKGFETLCLEFPLFRFLKKDWDKSWRIISYEIPEKRREIRDRLRREMQGWGLGPWHRSFWITPHPIIENLKELVVGKEEEKYIQSFESKHAFGDVQILIEKVWKKSELDKKYREVFQKWHDILSKDQSKEEKFKQVIKEYVSLLRQDPGLPKEIVGERWIAFEAFGVFKEIKSILISQTG